MLAIGIDVSKKKIDCCLRETGTRFREKNYINKPSGFQKLIDWVESRNSSNSVLRFVLEATGTYHESLAHFLFKKGYQVVILNPSQSKSYCASLGIKVKTDRSDAKALACYGAERECVLWEPPCPDLTLLEQLLLRIEVLKTDQQREKNRLEAIDHSAMDSSWVEESIQKMLQFYEQEIEALQKKVKDHIDRSPELKKDIELLASIPGVGEETAQWLLTLLKQKNFQGPKQVVSFMGINPKIYESGTSVKRKSHISKQGNPVFRKKFYFPAIVAIKHNPILGPFFQTLVEKGKPKKAALIAVMRKLVHMAYGVLKNQIPFDPNFLQKTA